MAEASIPPSGIYCIRNLISGRVYVGSSIKLRRRLQEHRRQLRAGVHIAKAMQRSWNKHGEASFEFSVIEAVEAERLIEREQFWIDRLNAASRTKGFNSAPTAGNCLGVRHSAETRAKQSAARKGVPKSPEHRKAIGDAQVGKIISDAQRAVAAANTRKFFDAHPEARERMREVGRRNGLARRGSTIKQEVREKISRTCKASPAFMDSARDKLANLTHEQRLEGWKKAALSRVGQPRRDKRTLTFEEAEQVRRDKSAGATYRDLAHQWGLSAPTLFQIVKRKTYRNP